ncbi:MAG: prolyl oligopeptidase family serine peptidase [Armatimonadetes bacterium]|nr:prolyl oligopeptidase family serine peptidase [Armatimonadota bacterium]
MLVTALLVALHTSQTAAPPEILTEGLAIRGVVRSGRIPFPTDAIQLQLAEGKWSTPKAGDEVELASGSKQSWTSFKADANGAINQGPFQGGYALFNVVRAQPEIVILEASGHGVALINGVPRAGDPYGNGYLKLPIQLETGANTLLFGAGRGNLNVRLVRPSVPASFNMADLTVPDLVVGQGGEMLAGIIVMNATASEMSGLSVQTRVAGGAKVTTEVPPIPPLGVYKVPVKLKVDAPTAEGTAEATFALVGPSGMLEFQRVPLRVRSVKQTRKVTFLSAIDGSVQYYGLNPAQTPGIGKSLILSPHGAGVEGIGQADAYSGKDWAHLAAPTNRRPFGFDWEDWGEEDAIEVLKHAQTTLATDPAKTYLTGHSMGGHGTWHLGVTYPNLFAAIGPSAGWVSFFSYAGSPRSAPTNPVEEIFYRAMNGSDTLAQKKNYLNQEVYILHGDADDNVPVREARTMKEQLTQIGAKFGYHEQPGAGHWWDGDAAPGADCVDWPPMMKLFQDSALKKPADALSVSFCTFDPARSGQYLWARIDSQNIPYGLSSVELARQPGRIVGKTVNVRRLIVGPEAIDRSGRVFIAELDGQSVSAPLPTDPKDGLAYEMVDDAWICAGPAGTTDAPKRRHQFKSAFRNGAWLVYGTSGTPEENAWSLAKARFDAEQFGYRGNGAFRVMSDAAFLATLDDPSQTRDRNVVLYGNSETNRTFSRLLKEAPVQVRSGKLTVGEKEQKGVGLGCLFVYPRPDSKFAMVGVVAGTGLQGMAATNRLPYFVSGVQYPDWCVFDTKVYASGLSGVIGAGYFDDDWVVRLRQSAWRDRP